MHPERKIHIYRVRRKEMGFRINWDCGNVFAVPDSAVDKGLKLASGKAVKVLMYIMRFKSDEGICDYLGISREDEEDALSYWEQLGILTQTDASAPAEKETASPPSEDKQTAATVKSPSTVKPQTAVKLHTAADITKRINESEEIRDLFDMVEASLGRPLTFNDHSTLIWIHDYLGMCPEVLIMLVNYCIGIGKANMRYIERIALSWADEGIDTGKKADEKILALQKSRSLIGQYMSALRINRVLTKKEDSCMKKWAAAEVSTELLMNAYDRTVNNTGSVSFPYMDKILSDWIEKGIKSSAEADDYSGRSSPAARQRSENSAKPTENSAPGSFDIDLILEHAKNTPLKLRSSDQQ